VTIPLPMTVVEEAAARIAPQVRETPIMRKQALDDDLGVPVHLKCEHLQHTGSFKIRGAINLISQLDDDARAGGVVAASAGNHAQGVAVAAREYGVHATIFMPEDASLSKVAATRSYHADVRLVGRDFSETLDAAHTWATETGATFIHPFNDERIIAGQATLGLELARQVPDCHTVVVPVGGGGLIAGVASTMKSLLPGVRVVGVQSSACPSLKVSLDRGAPTAVEIGPTMADGIAVKQPGEMTLAYARELVDDVVLVDDNEIALSLLWLMERGKQVVEASGGAGLAAVQAGKVSADGPIAVVLGGGNIDPVNLVQVIRYGMTTAGRVMRVTTTLRDRPGELARLLDRIAELKVNVLAVEHQRDGVDIHVGETSVSLALQTRNHEHVAEVLAALAANGYPCVV
jgi:threonine dehydratase